MTGSPRTNGEDDLLALYRTMVLIREFEEATIDMYQRGEIPGLVHSYSGQEAVAVGVCSLLRDTDYMTSTHRGHGHCIAKGANVEQMMLEIAGKADGYCRGKGGSMHIADLRHGILGANGVVAGGVGIALGASYSVKYRGDAGVVVCWIGDGAMNQGVTFEAFNMARLWNLPIIYVCENNQYGQYSAVTSVTAGNLLDRARAFEIPAVRVDGMDLLAVREAVAPAVEAARAGAGPHFFEMETYRYYGHHVAELNVGYREREEIEKWRERDPIASLARRLVDEGTAQAELEDLQRAVRETITRARERARTAPDPDEATLFQQVYAGGDL